MMDQGSYGPNVYPPIGKVGITQFDNQNGDSQPPSMYLRYLLTNPRQRNLLCLRPLCPRPSRTFYSRSKG